MPAWVIGKFEEFVSLFSFVTTDNDVFQTPKPSYAQALCTSMADKFSTKQ
jgi:hypothetical protein